MVRHKVFSILFAIIFLLNFYAPVYAESTHPFELYMPTPIYEDNVPASAVFISYYVSATEAYYCRYMYSTVLNNNLVYIDTTTPHKLQFETGKYFGFTFPFSGSEWSYVGEFNNNTGVFKNATMGWILENALIYTNVDILDNDGNILFGKNSQIIDGVLVPNDYEEQETPDYDAWYESIFAGIQNWFSGVLEVLATPFTAIADGLAGLWAEVSKLANTIKEDLKSLFIPSVNIIPLIYNKFTDKFPIINQAVDLFSSLYNIGTEEPIFRITYNGMTLKIINFTMFSDYMPLIRNFTGVFLLLSFVTREVKKLPRLLRGRD